VRIPDNSDENLEPYFGCHLVGQAGRCVVWAELAIVPALALFDDAGSDSAAMRSALSLAARADHRTSPNPMVGALIVDADGAVVGRGYHHRPGEPHAEILALREAGSRAHGATLVVTLEPCSVQGRTPPCVDAIVAAGIRRVVMAAEDPDATAQGRGRRWLEEAGVEVVSPVREEQARRLNEFYEVHRRTGRPFVTAKFAASWDGRVATRSGESKWITGLQARHHAHLLRHRHDAVLVGVNTVLADDPELTARFPGARQPLRVVLDSRGRTPIAARVRAPAGELLIDPGSDLRRLLERLAGRGVLSLLVEGGPTVLGSFFDQGLVNKVYAYIAPLIVGGERARPAVGGEGAGHLESAPHLDDVEMRRLGKDFLLSGYVHRNR